MLETHPFGNFVPENIKHLLLGSFTARGINSEPQYDWFYSSKRNQFWPILEEVYNTSLSDKTSKTILLTKLEIGIADIIYQCERRDGNSLDTNLINIVYNPDLKNILRNNDLQSIFFTSRYVENQYRKVFKYFLQELSNIKLITLPSPSPRYAKLKFDEKVRIYKELLPSQFNS